MSWNLSRASFKLMGGIILLIILAGCSEGQNPLETQIQEDSPVQQSLNTPTISSPTDSTPPTPTESNFDDLDLGSQEGYPYHSPGDVDSNQENQDPESFPSTPGYPSPDNEVSAPTPVLKTELEATDPSTFNLTSGDIQLVEFFAFW